MELQFQKNVLSCLETLLQEIQNREQTLEIKLPEGMPDIGRILAAWGQPVLRGKEWRDREILMTGGMTVWVLYAPEDTGQPRCINGWVPFQMTWELQEDIPQGKIRIWLLPRFVDARSVSPRKILIRAGLSAMAQALCPMEAEIAYPGEKSDRIELLCNTYPVRLPVQAGEKTFTLDEEQEVPPSAPVPEKLLCYRLQPEITDQKLLGNKLVFRGNGNLHVLYLSEEGQLFSWDFPMPFSQYAELDGAVSGDSQADIALCPTNVEVELDEEGRFRIKCAMVAQYVVDRIHLLELTEDAYCPGGDLVLQSRELKLPEILENRREILHGEATVPADAGIVTDVQFLPDFPRQSRTENGICMELPGLLQVLYYGEEGGLQSATVRWEGRRELPADDTSRITPVPAGASAQIQPGSIQAKLEVSVQLTVSGGKGMTMVTGGQLGEGKTPDPRRPSLIVRRAGDGGLWEMAKASGSTMDAIRKANGLDADPIPGQMLLIPVSG